MKLSDFEEFPTVWAEVSRPTADGVPSEWEYHVFVEGEIVTYRPNEEDADE